MRVFVSVASSLYAPNSAFRLDSGSNILQGEDLAVLLAHSHSVHASIRPLLRLCQSNGDALNLYVDAHPIVVGLGALPSASSSDIAVASISDFADDR